MFLQTRKPTSLGAMLRAGAWYAFLYMIVWAVADRFVPGWSTGADSMVAMAFFFGFGEMASGYRLARRDGSVPPEHAMGVGLVGVAVVVGAGLFWLPPERPAWWWVALAFLCFLAGPLYLLVGGAAAAFRERR